MKATVFAIVTALAVTFLVILNSCLLSYHIGALIEKSEAIPCLVDEGDRYEELYKDFMKRQKFISLTVSHDDLTEIENELAEILGAIEAEDEGAPIIAKSRLLMTLTHLRRLTGVNLDSIF